MSTILQALKKLEQDKETLGAKGLPEMTAAAASGIRRSGGRFSRPGRVLAIGAIGLAFVCVAGAAVYFYLQSRDSQPPPARSAITPSASKRSQVTPGSRRKRIPTKPAPQAVPEPKPLKSSPPRKVPTRRPASPIQERVGEGVMPEKPANPGSPVPSSARGENPNLDSPTPKTRKQPSTSTPAVQMPAARTSTPQTPPSNDSDYANANRLTDNRLKIQAIAWSPNPEERMAVINSHIVREGGSVEGFSVVAIRQDDVIVREQGRLYRAIFGKP